MDPAIPSPENRLNQKISRPSMLKKMRKDTNNAKNPKQGGAT